MEDARGEAEVETALKDYPSSEPESEPEMFSPTENYDVMTFAEGMGMVGERPWYLRPEPNWTVLVRDCGVPWGLHNYTTATVFLFLFLISLIHLIKVIRIKDSVAKPYYLALQLLLLGCGLTRTIHFFSDPYHSTGNIPLVLSLITLHTFDPFILSAFLLVYVALVKVTRMQALTLSEYLLHPVFLITLITINFLVVVSTDIVVSYVMGTSLYKFICQLYFIVFGLAASGCYMFLFFRLFSRIYLTRVKLNRMSKVIWKGKGVGCSNGQLLGNGGKEEFGSKPEDMMDKQSEVAMIERNGSMEENMNSPDRLQSPLSVTVTSPGGCSTDSQTSTQSTKPFCPTNDKEACPKMAAISEQEEGGESDESFKIEFELSEKQQMRRRLSSIKDPVEAKVPIAAKLVLLSAGVFFLLSLSNILLTLLAALRVCESESGVADSWYWLGYQTAMRLLEFTMVGVIAAIAAMPLYNMS